MENSKKSKPIPAKLKKLVLDARSTLKVKTDSPTMTPYTISANL